MIRFYGGAFLTCIVAGFVLALVGQHLFLRKESLQVFSLSQVLLFFFLMLNLIFPDTQSFLKILLGYGLMLVMRLLIPSSLNGKENSELVMVGVYLFFLSLQYFFLSLFPGLDSVHSFALFGSVVTLESRENLFVVSSFLLFLLFYAFNKKPYMKETLESVLFSKKIDFSARNALLSLIIVISLFFLGQIYTLSFILLPYLVLSRSFASQKLLMIFISIINILAGVLGLALSLHFERLSTVPTQVFILVVVLFLVLLFDKKK
jgi:ABC-type Mn2+/Zn2+ transport system permease subunit